MRIRRRREDDWINTHPRCIRVISRPIVAHGVALKYHQEEIKGREREHNTCCDIYDDFVRPFSIYA